MKTANIYKIINIDISINTNLNQSFFVDFVNAFLNLFIASINSIIISIMGMTTIKKGFLLPFVATYMKKQMQNIKDKNIIKKGNISSFIFYTPKLKLNPLI